MVNAPHKHGIIVKFLGHTDTKGVRVKLTSKRFEESITLNYDYAVGDVQGQAEQWLIDNGFTVNSWSYDLSDTESILLVNEFKPLKGGK